MCEQQKDKKVVIVTVEIDTWDDFVKIFTKGIYTCPDCGGGESQSSINKFCIGCHGTGWVDQERFNDITT